MYSFIYPNPSSIGRVGNAIKDLHVNNIVNFILQSNIERQYVLNILSEFQSNIEIIKHRQRLIFDFINSHDLYKELENELNKLSSLNQEYIRLRDTNKDFGKIKRQNINYDNNFDLYFVKMKDMINALCNLVVGVMKVYKNIINSLNKYQLTSSALNELKELISKKTNSKSFQKLFDTLSYLLLSSKNYNISVTLNDILKITDSSLLITKDEEERKKIFKKKSEPKGVIPYTNNSINEFNYMFIVANEKLIDILSDLFFGLYNPLSNCIDELVFIKFSLKYYELVNKLDLQFCFPTFNQGDEFILENNSDLYLGIRQILEGYKNKHIVSNDYIIKKEEAGTIIIGDNNSGKTVFLRSVGVAQILAQAGLFITASKANLFIKENLVTLLSSKEVNTSAGGRFEKEVSMLKEVIEQVDKNSLIIMNEIFQSTSTKDGIEALFNILSYFSKKNAYWIVVTHLKDFIMKEVDFKKENNQGFKVLKTENNYILIER